LRLGFLLALLSCGGVSPRPASPGPRGWRYVFSLDEALGRLDAEICFDGPPPPSLRSTDAEAEPLLLSATAHVGGRDVDISAREGRIALPAGCSCARYAVDLERATDRRRGVRLATRSGEDVVLPTGSWLWGPVRRPAGFRATARFRLPPSVNVSVPWPREGEDFVLREPAYHFMAYAAFGRFEIEEYDAAGTTLQVARLDGPDGRPDAVLVREWLTAQAGAAASLYGRLGFDRAQIVVLPVGPAAEDSPAPFGTVSRGGGASLIILLAENADPVRLRCDWVAVHELTHLSLPFVRREDAWISEGIATYFQEVLRARGGLVDPIEAWRAMDVGFRQGRRGTGRTLQDESRLMFRTFAFQRVYWGGAAIAFFADVEIRAHSGGRKSLESALRTMDPFATRTLSADEVMAQIDRAVGAPIFSRIARRHLASREAPDPAETYRRLGIVREEIGVRLVDGPDSAIRDAITAARDPDPPLQETRGSPGGSPAP